MENIQIAKVCGLCAGCLNAIETAKTELQKQKPVVIFKEIVHNKNVNSMLKNLGAETKDDIYSLNPNETIILRAHGEPPETYEYLSANEFQFIDCTCINVTKIHEKISEFYLNGYQPIIIGKYKSKMHPEVLGTNGWTNYASILVEDELDLEKIFLSQNDKFYLICQTTFNEKKADKLISQISDIIHSKNKELIINKSICGAQKAINKSSAELAHKVDLMLVVGSPNSSNTVELFNNIKTITKCVFIDDIENWKELLNQNKIQLSNSIKIGITAGASAMKEDLIYLKNSISKHLENLYEY